MTNGQKVALAAMRHLGVTEDPWGSNTDDGGPIDAWEMIYRLHAEPWCAMFAGAMYREAGVDDSGLIDPGTAVICQRSDRMGAWWRGGPVPAGALWVRCGFHVEIVLADEGNGVLANIGGNVNQGVRRTWRRISDGRIVVPPQVSVGEPELATVYGFDDPRLAPRRYGGWSRREAREQVIADLPHERRRMARRINIGGMAPYAFEILPGRRWHFGPWEDKEVRDRAMAEYSRQHNRRQMRPWAQRIRPAGSGRITSGDTTT